MKMIFFARLSLCLALLSLVQVAFCQEVALKYNGSGSYSYIERTNLRRYDNGKYVGLVNREVRSFIARTSAPAGANPADSYYDGSFFVDESTLRNYEQVRDSVSGAIPSSFKISPNGELTMLTDFGYPSFRSFPAFPTQKIKVGDKWQAKAERVIDPLNKGVITKMPILVEYTYLQDDVFNDEEVYVFSAQWATRYGLSYWDFSGDKELKSAQGSHKATMYVSKRTGNALVVRDQVDETFVYKDGNSYAFKGTISMFTEYPPAYDKRRLFPALQRVAGLSEEELERVLQKPAEGAGGTSAGSSANTDGTSAKGAGTASTKGSAADKRAAPIGTQGAGGAQAASASGKTTGGSAVSGGVAQASTSDAARKDKDTGDAAAGGSAGSSASSDTGALGSASPSKNTAAANAGTAGTTGSTDGSVPPQAGIAGMGATSQQSDTLGQSGAAGSGGSGGTNSSGMAGEEGTAGSSKGTSSRDLASSGASGGTLGGGGSNSALSSDPSGSAALISQGKQSNKSAKGSSGKNATKQPKATKADIEQKIASAQSQQAQRSSSQPSGTGAPKSVSSSATTTAEKKVTVESTSSGIRLTMQNLNFKPDSAELLPGEAERLDQIAAVLKEVSDQMFLVEGHTASVGKVAGEKQLSIERANAIAEALVKRGIPRERFICKGSGGTKPVADNSTQQGRAKNRRVEITILE